MLYGDQYGEFYGDAIALIESHVVDGLNRLVYAVRDADDLKKMITIFLERVQAIENVYTGIRPSLLFDIPTAYGPQLDQIGSIVGLPREGWDDDLYRIYLRTQALLILPDRRTQIILIQVIRSLMDTLTNVIVYTELRPKTYIVDITGPDLATLVFWNRKFLERCRPITYNVLIIFHPEDAFGYLDDTAVVAPDVEGFSDDTATIDVGGPYSAVV